MRVVYRFQHRVKSDGGAEDGASIRLCTAFHQGLALGPRHIVSVSPLIDHGRLAWTRIRDCPEGRRWPTGSAEQKKLSTAKTRKRQLLLIRVVY